MLHRELLVRKALAVGLWPVEVEIGHGFGATHAVLAEVAVILEPLARMFIVPLLK